MIKIKYADLVELINRLTPSEKVRFNESVSPTNKKSNFYLIYKLIESGKYKKEQDISKHFTSEQAFHDAKKYLFSRLKESITIELAQSDPELGKLHTIQFAHALYKKEMYPLSEKILLDTLEESINSVEAGIQIIVAILLMRIGFVKQDFDLMESSDNKLYELLDYIGLVEKYRSFKLELNNGARLNAISDFDINKFMRDESYFKTPRDQNGYNYFMAKLFEKKYGDFDKSYIYHCKSYSIFKAHLEHAGTSLNLQNFETALFILHHYIYACLNVNKPESALTALKEQLNFEEKSVFKSNFSAKLNIASTLLYSMLTEVDLVEVLKRVEKDVQLLKIESKNKIDLNGYLFYVSNLFLIGEYENVIRYTNQAFGLLAGSLKKEYYVFYGTYLYFLFIAAHLQFNNFEVADKYFMRFKKEIPNDLPHIQNWKQLTLLLIDCKKAIVANDLLTLKAKFKKLNQFCNLIQQNTFHKFYSFINLYSWYLQLELTWKRSIISEHK